MKAVTEIERFDRVERMLHWVTAALVGTLIATGAVLYLGDLSAIVGRRDLMRNIHVAAGLSLPVPVLLSLLSPAGRGLRRDFARLGRWSADDRRWWRRGRRDHVRLPPTSPQSGDRNGGDDRHAIHLRGPEGASAADADRAWRGELLRRT